MPSFQSHTETAALVFSFLSTDADMKNTTSHGSVRYATEPSKLHEQAADIVKSQNERHSYEKCQYEEFKKRVKKMDELRAAKDGARSN